MTILSKVVKVDELSPIVEKLTGEQASWLR